MIKKDKHIITIKQLNKRNKHLYFNIELLQELSITYNVTLLLLIIQALFFFFFFVKTDSLSFKHVIRIR
jgi:hypothetical protein